MILWLLKLHAQRIQLNTMFKDEAELRKIKVV